MNHSCRTSGDLPLPEPTVLAVCWEVGSLAVEALQVLFTGRSVNYMQPTCTIRMPSHRKKSTTCGERRFR